MKKLLILALASLAATSLQAQKLVIKGSDTLGAKLVPMLSEEYKAQYPGVSFEIAAEGSTTGIAAITDSTADIGMASRRAKPTEMSAAQAKGIPISDLTPRQVEQIFTGDITDWSALGGPAGRISVYTRNTSSGTYSDFKALAMKKRDYASSSQKMAGNEQIAAEVAKNPNGIGYVGMAYISDPGIKAVGINGSHPSKETVLSKAYPYARPTFYYTNGEPVGEAAKFIEFTLSDEGQKIVEKVGFVAIR
jgi:phosphate transport system substrate-binding protein